MKYILPDIQVFGAPGDEIIGEYRRYPVTNDWHKVSLCKTFREGVYSWVNAANVEWTVYYVGTYKNIPRYAFGTDCPYYDSKYSGGMRTAKLIMFDNGTYSIQGQEAQHLQGQEAQIQISPTPTRC